MKTFLHETQLYIYIYRERDRQIERETKTDRDRNREIWIGCLNKQNERLIYT